jgi:hypothetical protein
MKQTLPRRDTGITPPIKALEGKVLREGFALLSYHCNDPSIDSCFLLQENRQ